MFIVLLSLKFLVIGINYAGKTGPYSWFSKKGFDFVMILIYAFGEFHKIKKYFA